MALKPKEKNLSSFVKQREVGVGPSFLFQDDNFLFC
jgi:hypothetical protein